jgi:hypothetical protein
VLLFLKKNKHLFGPAKKEELNQKFGKRYNFNLKMLKTQ